MLRFLSRIVERRDTFRVRGNAGAVMSMRWSGDGMTAVVFAAIAGLGLAGCSGGGRVDEQLAEPAALRISKQAIGIFRLATPDPSCLTTAVSIGVREGPLFRPQQTLRLQQTAVTTVLEVLLEPGEYHVLGFACYRARSKLVMAEPKGDGLLRRSYASFNIAAGEVVNLGQIRLTRAGRTPGVFSSFVGVTVEVSDWPLPELERFKSQRPKLYAEMKTRLMAVAPVTQLTPDVVEQKCAEFARLRAEGKVQNVPPACSASPVPKGSPRT